MLSMFERIYDVTLGLFACMSYCIDFVYSHRIPIFNLIYSTLLYSKAPYTFISSSSAAAPIEYNCSQLESVTPLVLIYRYLRASN